MKFCFFALCLVYRVAKLRLFDGTRNSSGNLYKQKKSTRKKNKQEKSE